MQPACIHQKCLCPLDCAVVGCLLSNPLLSDDILGIYGMLLMVKPKQRIKLIIDLLQEKRHPKVNRAKLDNYYCLLKRGLDIDRRKISMKKLVAHRNLKNNPLPKYTVLTAPGQYQQMTLGRLKAFYKKSPLFAGTSTLRDQAAALSSD